jgi:hypothetical protein
MSWELRLIENMGELLGSPNSESVVVPTKPLLEDMQKQLKFMPKNFTWTVGWRTYVWQETEKKEFKDLTQSEHDKLYDGETISYTEDGGEGDKGIGTTTSDEGSVTQ